jgi:hypothetical protein
MTLRIFYDNTAIECTIIVTKALTQRHPPNLAAEASAKSRKRASFAKLRD